LNQSRIGVEATSRAVRYFQSSSSSYVLCKAIEFNQGAMSRFMSGKGGMSLDTLNQRAELLGLSVMAGRPAEPTA
jgi:hypothetical protein